MNEFECGALSVQCNKPAEGWSVSSLSEALVNIKSYLTENKENVKYKILQLALEMMNNDLQQAIGEFL